jgi:hypothetical protein
MDFERVFVEFKAEVYQTLVEQRVCLLPKSAERLLSRIDEHNESK